MKWFCRIIFYFVWKTSVYLWKKRNLIDCLKSNKYTIVVLRLFVTSMTNNPEVNQCQNIWKTWKLYAKTESPILKISICKLDSDDYLSLKTIRIEANQKYNQINISLIMPKNFIEATKHHHNQVNCFVWFEK